MFYAEFVRVAKAKRGLSVQHEQVIQPWPEQIFTYLCIILFSSSGSITVWNVICLTVWLLTYELLVPDIQRHVSQSSGNRAHHPVVIHPQQLHQDGQSLLLTHCCTDVCCKLSTHKQKHTKRHLTFKTVLTPHGEIDGLEVRILEGVIPSVKLTPALTNTDEVSR